MEYLVFCVHIAQPQPLITESESAIAPACFNLCPVETTGLPYFLMLRNSFAVIVEGSDC